MNKQQESIMNMATLASKRANDLLVLCIEAQEIMLSSVASERSVADRVHSIWVVKWLAEFSDYLEKAVAEDENNAE